MSVNTTAAAASSSTPCRVAVAGASGRMGRMLIEAIRASDDCVLAGALDVPSSPGIGSDACAFLGYASGVAITADLKVGLQNADVLIDFTRPEGTLAHMAVCAELGVKAVIGTTGFTDAQKAELDAFAQRTAIMFSPNMSVGVNVTLKLLQMAAKAMANATQRRAHSDSYTPLDWNALLDNSAAETAYPTLVRRLRRLRESRTQARSPIAPLHL